MNAEAVEALVEKLKSLPPEQRAEVPPALTYARRLSTTNAGLPIHDGRVGRDAMELARSDLDSRRKSAI